MRKFLLAVVLVMSSLLVYAQEEPRIDCASRAFLYSEVVKLRDTKKYTELDILKGLAKYLWSRGIPQDEGREILLESQKAYKNKKLYEKGTFLKYLGTCAGTEI